MKKLEQTLRMSKFERIILIWTNIETKQACIRDRVSGKSKIINF